MTRYPVAQSSHRTSVIHDLEALALALGILAVVLALCLVSAIWPEAI